MTNTWTWVQREKREDWREERRPIVRGMVDPALVVQKTKPAPKEEPPPPDPATIIARFERRVAKAVEKFNKKHGYVDAAYTLVVSAFVWDAFEARGLGPHVYMDGGVPHPIECAEGPKGTAPWVRL